MFKKIDLEDCPFCGIEPTYDIFLDLVGEIHRAKCKHCDIFMDRRSKEDLERAWNRRVNESIE